MNRSFKFVEINQYFERWLENDLSDSSSHSHGCESDCLDSLVTPNPRQWCVFYRTGLCYSFYRGLWILSSLYRT